MNLTHPLLEPRSMYGYPIVVDKLAKAQRIAAEVRIRKAEKCDCAVCHQLKLKQRLIQSNRSPK